MKVIFENLSLRDWVEIKIAIERQRSEVEESIQKWREKDMDIVVLQNRHEALIRFVKELERGG